MQQNFELELVKRGPTTLIKHLLTFCSVSILGFASVAHADSIDTFTETTVHNQCCFQVVLDQKSATDVQVTVTTVGSGVYFAKTGSGQHPTFAFNLSGVSGVSLTDYDTTDWLGSTTSVTTGGPGFGTFQDQFNIISGGGTSSKLTSLVFDVTVSSGTIDFSNFVKTTGDGYYFTADFGAPDHTASGAISNSPALGTTGVTGVTAPEPSSLFLLGTGIIGAAGMLRKRVAAEINQ
jgi:hypothetical protein